MKLPPQRDVPNHHNSRLEILEKLYKYSLSIYVSPIVGAFF